VNRYVVLPDMAAEALALWVVHTYAFQLRQVTTYIGVVSPEKRCGKTTLLELLGRLANRSLTAANISPSALFRVIEETKPTLLIDEADTFLQGRDELAGILNAGYRKGNAYVVRVAEGKVWRKEERTPEFGEWTQDYGTDFAKYSCWCPKVMAAIGRLPDTLADRCIIITMQRKMAGEKCERMRHLNAEEYRKRCDEFVQLHSQTIAEARPEIPSTLNDRAADIWEPLLAIADLAGGDWPRLARDAALKLSASEEEMTLLGYFLKDLRNLMMLKNVDRMLSRDIVAVFNPMHHRPWEDLRRGRDVNEWWLGWQLRELGIRAKTMRVNNILGKGYLLEDFDSAFRRYVSHPEIHSVPGPEPNPEHAHAEAPNDN
jgi:putative DNA primase/helicase